MRSIKTEWDLAILKYESGGLFKKDIIDLLRRGIVPPEDALLMLADILDNDGRKLRNGRRPVMVDLGEGPVEGGNCLPQLVEFLQIAYDIPRQKAKILVAKRYEVSMRKLEEWLQGRPEPLEISEAQKAYEERIQSAWKDAQ